jgi:allophycocyanin-B
MAPLSESVKELIAKSRIVSFEHWHYPAEAITLFQAADDNGRYLNDTDIDQLRTLLPQLADGLAIAQRVRDQAPELVEMARAKVLQQFPQITQSGGELYPLERAEACWRDFWHFLRCISYGIAGQQPNYTSPVGLSYMEQLYQALKVPLPAMITGLKQLQQSTTTEIPAPFLLAPYFEHLIDHLEQFQGNR